MIDVPIPTKELDFSVQKEDWSKYEILDGQARIWIRTVLVKVLELQPPQGAVLSPGAELVTSTQNVVTAFFEPALKGPPGNKAYSPQELATGGMVLTPSTIEEPFNEYIIAGKKSRMIRIKVVATNVRLHKDKWNGFGDPIVQVDSQVVVSPPVDAPGHVSA